MNDCKIVVGSAKTPSRIARLQCYVPLLRSLYAHVYHKPSKWFLVEISDIMMNVTRDIDTSLLRAFVTAVDTGNFSRAARQLNRTQGALSMQIKRLEELVSAPLFERSVRPPSMTPEGEVLVAFAREILAINDQALETVRTRNLAGNVRLALMEDYAATKLAPLIRAFSAEHEQVQIEVETGLTRELLDQLGSHFDIVIAMVEPGTQEGKLIHRGRSIWAAAPRFKCSSHDLLPLALAPHGCLFRQWATRALDAHGKRWRLGLVSSSYSAVVAAAQEGWCLSVFKDSTLPPGLRPLGVDDGLPDLPEFEIRLFSAPSARSGAARKFADFLSNQLRDRKMGISAF